MPCCIHYETTAGMVCLCQSLDAAQCAAQVSDTAKGSGVTNVHQVPNCPQ